MIYYDIFYRPEHLTREEMYKKYIGKKLLVNNVKSTDSNIMLSADVVVAERFGLQNFRKMFTFKEEQNIWFGKEDKKWNICDVFKKAVYIFCLKHNAVGYAPYMYNRMNEHLKRYTEGRELEDYGYDEHHIWEYIKDSMDNDKLVEWKYLLSNIQAEYIVTITYHPFNVAFKFDDIKKEMYHFFNNAEPMKKKMIVTRAKMEQEEFSDRTGAILINSMKNLADYLQTLYIKDEDFYANPIHVGWEPVYDGNLSLERSGSKAAYAAERAGHALANYKWRDAEKYIKEFLENKDDIKNVKDMTANYCLNRLVGFNFDVLMGFYNRCIQYMVKNITDEFTVFASTPIKNDVNGLNGAELIKRWSP